LLNLSVWTSVTRLGEISPFGRIFLSFGRIFCWKKYHPNIHLNKLLIKILATFCP
jgi:hypothetical protein